MSGFEEGSPVLDVISLKVKNAEEALPFYVELLGFDMLVEENNIAYLGSKKTKRAIIALYEFTEGVPVGQQNNVVSRFSIDVPSKKQFDEICAKLVKVAYPFKKSAGDESQKSIRLVDPEGHVIDLINLASKKKVAEKSLHLANDLSEKMYATGAPKKGAAGLTLHAVRLSVSDVLASHKFYTEVLDFKEKLDQKGLKLEVSSKDEDYLRLTKTTNRIASDDKYFGLDYLAFRLPNAEDLTAYAAKLRDKQQDIYYNQKQGLIEIDDPDGNHLWFYY